MPAVGRSWPSDDDDDDNDRYDNHDDDDRDDDHEDDHNLTSKATSPLGATSSLLVLNLLAGKHCILYTKLKSTKKFLGIIKLSSKVWEDYQNHHDNGEQDPNSSILVIVT